MKPIKFLIIALIGLQMALFAAVGEIKVLNGDVVIDRVGKTVKAACNTPIEEKDVITTKARANIQVVFSDGTSISIGQNTNFKVQEYLYDEKSNKANLKVGITEGTFKAVTGRIGKISPDKFKLETKTATMGIRGTRFLGSVPKEGADTIACTEGAITVAPLKALATGTQPEPIVVNAGEIIKVSEDGSTTVPRKYNPTEIREIEMSTSRSCNCQ